MDLNLFAQTRLPMSVEATAKEVIDSLLPIGATVSSIYIVILTFIFSKYEEIGVPATPGSTVYFSSGSLLLLSFISGAVGTLWMLGMRIMILPYNLVPAYLLGGSFLILLCGTTLLGIGVIGTDIQGQSREIRLWFTERLTQVSSSDYSDDLGSALNPLVITGVGITLSQIGYVLLGQVPLGLGGTFTVLCSISLAVYGLYSEKVTGVTSDANGIAIITLLIIAIFGSGLLATTDIRVPIRVHLALAIGVLLGYHAE